MFTRDEQRARDVRRQMVSIGLEAHLHNLMHDIQNGDISKLPEFQEMIQYAPSEMKFRLLEWLWS